MVRVLLPLLVLTGFMNTAVPSFGQVWTQSFETNGLGVQYFATSVFTNSPNAYFNRATISQVSNVNAPYSGLMGNFFWGGENMDDVSGGGDGLDNKLITFAPINIAGLSNLEFRGLFGTGNPNNGWDYTDALYVEYQVDLGPWTKLMQFASPAVSGNVGLFYDANMDGLGEGPSLEPQLHQFVAAIPTTGNTLNLRIYASANGTGEEFAFDFLRVYDTTVPTTGCTNPNASNFDVTAIVNDGSCLFTGCTNASALNYDPQANVDNGACIFNVPNIIINEIHYNPSSYAGYSDTDYEFVELYNNSASTVSIAGWRISQAVDVTFPPGATIAAGGFVLVASNATTYSGMGFPVYQFTGSLSNTGDVINLVENNNIQVDIVEYFPNPSWPTAADSNGPSLELINYLLPNTNPLNWCSGTVDNGSPGSVNSCYTLIPGCTDASASNYYFLAQVDDNSCLYPGCTYPAATNYSATANLDNGTCFFPQGTNCPSDINNDNVINVADLLLFMADFGQQCP